MSEMSSSSLIGGGYVPPSIGSSGSPANYIADILYPEGGNEKSEHGDSYSRSHHRREHEGGKESFWDRYPLFRYIIYGLAAFGAWKLGLGKLARMAFDKAGKNASKKTEMTPE